MQIANIFSVTFMIHEMRKEFHDKATVCCAYFIITDRSKERFV